ncbi:MAG: hypothetical protein JWP75_3705 [Frondihabitans sp.]|nr:hypothetical protein [Frondihabitans sp.]
MTHSRWSRAHADASYRAQLQREFAAAGGAGSALDELGWREGRAPEGAPDPAHLRKSLVEAAYGPTSDAGAARARRQELAAFDTHRARQGRALDAAIIALEAATAPGATAPAEATPSSELASDADSPRPAQRRRTAFVLGAAFAATAVAAFTVGSVVTGITGRDDASSPSADAPAGGTGTSLAAKRATTELGRVLARNQRATDVPPGEIYGVPSHTYRLLYDGSVDSAGDPTPWRIWVGAGISPSQLCVLGYSSVAKGGFDDCFAAARAYTDVLTFTHGAGSSSVNIRIDRGAYAINSN